MEPDAVDILMNVLKTVNDSKPNNVLRSYMENINFGKLTGIGVGPGDPELMTLKAINVIKNSDIIAFPGKSKDESMAFGIAEKAVPEIIEKELLAIDLPMTKDTKRLRKNHENAALTIEKHLKAGKIREVLKSAGYSAAMISNCGLENEEIFNNIDAIPDNASYFSLIIAKKNYMGYNSPSALH